jgi:regulation of enolase protein 1 (concanavalin A-like superfamily)
MIFIARIAAPLLVSLPIAASAATLSSLPGELALDAAHGDVRFQAGTLEIAADKGTDLFTDPVAREAADNAPRALFVPEGDFVFSARVSPGFGGAAYEGGALLAYAGPACWGKLLFERFDSGHNGVATTTSRGSGGDDAYHGTRESPDQYLKIVRQGPAYIFYTSADGVAWNFVRSFALPCGGPVRIGFSAQAPFSDGFAATFSEVRYRRGTISDYWQGE